MQNGKMLDIYVTGNNGPIVWYPPQEEKAQEKAIPLPQPREIQKHSLFKDIVSATVKQLFSFPQQPTKVTFTKSALEKMGEWGLTENYVKDVVLHGEVVRGKNNMISKKYNGYEIGVIAPFNKATHSYVVLSAWKRGRR